MASTSANRLGSKLPRETRTTAVAGNDSVADEAGRPRNPALDQAILSAAARQLGELGYARMSLESVAAAAGTTVPSLRRQYPNKAELAAAAVHVPSKKLSSKLASSSGRSSAT
jgi:AcrR family transcriptional regulator